MPKRCPVLFFFIVKVHSGWLYVTLVIGRKFKIKGNYLLLENISSAHKMFALEKWGWEVAFCNKLISLDNCFCSSLLFGSKI